MNDIKNVQDFDKFIYTYIITKNNNISSNAKRYKYFDILKQCIDDFQQEGDSTLEKLYLYINKTHPSTCKTCGKKLNFNTWSKPYNIFCSKKCIAIYRHQNESQEQKNNIAKKTKITKLKKYGDENYVNSKKANTTKLKRYGYISVFEKQDIQEKIKQTNLKNYGVERQLFRKEIHNKIHQTKLKKYGDENYNNTKQSKLTHNKKHNGIGFQSSIINNKIKQTLLEKYNITNISQFTEIQKKQKQTKKENFYLYLFSKWDDIIPLFKINEYENIQYINKYNWKCKTCNTEFYDDIFAGRKPRCPNCYPLYKSKGEKEIINFLSQFIILENSRQIIPPYEVDVYLPDYKLAIEYNGLYWHSIKFVYNKYYHQNKVKLANEKGIRLLHIWEHEWFEEKDLIKQIIQYYINNLNEEIKPEEPKLYNIHNNLIWI